MADYTGDQTDNTYNAPLDESNTIYGEGGDDSLVGGYLVDVIIGGIGDDTLIGLDGSDYLNAETGSDDLYGGGGDDSLYAYQGTEFDQKFIDAGGGDDYILVGAGSNTINGGQGQDMLTYYFDTGTGVSLNLQTGKGANAAAGDTYRSIEDVYGTYYADVLVGNGAFNELFGDYGDDLIRGGAGGDYLDGGNDFDRLDYRTSDAGVRVDLASGATFGGDAQGDQILDFEAVTGSDFADLLSGDGVANLLNGFAGNDVLAGRAGFDSLLGASGADRLEGWTGNDILRGGTQGDELVGGLGADLLYGDAGADRFVYRTTAESALDAIVRDSIADFARLQGDQIDLSAVDANTDATGNQGFSFNGLAAFGGTSGELRYSVGPRGNALVLGDVNGDRTADLSIEVSDTGALRAGDFLL